MINNWQGHGLPCPLSLNQRRIMENNKSINREIRKISNISSLPILVYCILSFLLINFAKPHIFTLLRRNGVTVTENFDSFIQSIIIYLVIFPLAIIAFKVVKGKNNPIKLKSCFCKPKRSIGWIVKWIVISFGTATVVPYVFGIIGYFFGFTLNTSITASVVTVPTYVVGVLHGMIFAPFFEEILFRGLIYKNNEMTGRWFSIIVSGLLFGFWHQTVEQIIFGSVVGMFCCFLYLKTKSIFPSMILHFILNSKAALLENLSGNINMYELSHDPLNGIMSNIEPILILLVIMLIIFAITVVGVIFLIIEFVKNKKSIFAEKRAFEISTVKKTVVYFTAPITLITYICLIYSTITKVVSL